MSNSRIDMTLKNIFSNGASTIITIVMSFISRTLFINILGKNYLGVNGLYTNILGALSFAELGIGTAMIYSLYKPVAEKDIDKIKSYMYYYKWSYRIIAIVIACVGLLLLPFLDKMVKEPGNIGNIKVYYIIFLLNAVSSYFVSYKESLLNAEQKNYICVNINAIFSIATTIIQCISIICFRNYLVYLIFTVLVGLGQKIYINRFYNCLYPYLKEKDIQRLSKKELHIFTGKIKALILHKFGEISINSTDNIIISTYVGIGLVGLLSNYNLVISAVNRIINIFAQSVIGSLGNLVAVETEKKQYEVYKTYRFILFWIYGFSSIALMLLLNPFITLWLGENKTISEGVIYLIVIDFYMKGHRNSIINLKNSAGLFENDRYLAFFLALLNLVLSVFFVRRIGVIGVFVGTLIQGSIASIVRPIIVYKQMFCINPIYYFIDSAKYIISLLAVFIICCFGKIIILNEISEIRFILFVIFLTVVTNLLFLCIFYKNDEFQKTYNIVKEKFYGK